MMDYTPLWLDLAAIAVIFGNLIYGWKMGFVRMLLRFLGSIFILFAAYYLGNLAAAPIAAYFREELVMSVGNKLSEVIDTGAQELLGGLLTVLPAELQQALFGTVIDPSAASGEVSFAELITDTAVIPMVEWLLSCIIFLICFTIGFAVLNALIKRIRLKHVFLIGFLDTGAGALVGTLQGVVMMVLVTCLFSLLFTINGGSILGITAEVIEKSTLFRLFYECNPFKLGVPLT